MNERISESVPVLPPAAALHKLPFAVVEYVLGAEVIPEYRGGDGVAIVFDGNPRPLARSDYELVRTIGLELEGELALGRIPSPKEVFRLFEHATRKVRKALEFREGLREKSVMMLKDKASSGWWRMILPVRKMYESGWRFDCTAAAVDFDTLMEYDTIFVQRLHDWDSFYVLERLKRAGKRIVYDIDDDLFNITPDNPAYGLISRDDQVAAAKCIKLADAVTVTTEELRKRIAGVAEGVYPIVIPNALDVHDRWLPTAQTGSPDGFRRIFWSGGASHAVDWEECFQAVKTVMAAREDVRLVILGFLPPCIDRERSLAPFKGRIEFMGFSNPETYYEIIHHIRADVALAPIRHTAFNTCKSPIKFLENSLIGIPTVASNWKPYSEVIRDGESGRLVKGHDEWVEAITSFIEKPALRITAVTEARKICEERFDLGRAAQEWTEVLCDDDRGSSDE
jgi:glycosyltransferase involved in cell wall biosynthesis